MMKCKFGKWHPKKKEADECIGHEQIKPVKITEPAKVEEQQEEVISHEEPIVEEQPEKVAAETPKTELPAGLMPFRKRMLDVCSILTAKEKRKSNDQIAVELGFHTKFIEEVLEKGYTGMEEKFRSEYHIPEGMEIPPIEVLATPTPKQEKQDKEMQTKSKKTKEITEEPETEAPKKIKKEKVVKEKKEKKEPLRSIIERLAPKKEFTAAEMIAIMNKECPDLYKDVSVKLHLMGLDTTNTNAEKNFPSLFKHAFLTHTGEKKDLKYQRV